MGARWLGLVFHNTYLTMIIAVPAPTPPLDKILVHRKLTPVIGPLFLLVIVVIGSCSDAVVSALGS